MTTPTLAEVTPQEEFLTTAVYQPPEIPEIEQDPVPEYQAPETWAPPPEATVAGQMKGLLESGSPYVEAAKQRGVAQAQSRGLLNSSIAASAGEKSAIEGALPIASQDATTHATAGLTGYQGQIDAAKMNLSHEQQKALLKADAAMRSALLKQESLQNATLTHFKALLDSGLSAQQARQATDISTHQALLQRGLNEQQAAIELNRLNAANALELQRLAKEHDYKKELVELQGQQDASMEALRQGGANARAAAENSVSYAHISSTEKQSTMSRIADITDGYNREVLAINTNPNLSQDAKNKLLKDSYDRYQRDMNLIAGMNGIAVTFNTTAGETAAATPATPGASGADTNITTGNQDPDAGPIIGNFG